MRCSAIEKKTAFIDLEKKNPLINVTVFIAVFFSSMLGAQFLGISLNKIALLPLEFVLFILAIKRKNVVPWNEKKRNLLFWFLAIILSSLVGLTEKDQLSGYEGLLLANIVQYIAIYIPILLMVNVINDPFARIKKSIVIVAEINSIWAIVQFVCWYLFSFDWNSFVFISLLKGVMGTKWTAWDFTTGVLMIRATGLNYDPAFLSQLMVFGFALSKSKLWKAFFLFTCICSMSRVGMVSIFLIVLYAGYKKITNHDKWHLEKNFLFHTVFFCLIIGMTFVYLYNSVEIVKNQTDSFVNRFAFVSSISTDNASMDVSSRRHSIYAPLSILVMAEQPMLNVLFGVGPRIGGSAITHSSYIKEINPSPEMLCRVWCVECDFAEILLGTGLFGLCLYYLNLFSLLRVKNRYSDYYKKIVMAVFLFGFMYGIGLNTLTVLLFIFMAADATLKSNSQSVCVESK